ncbi:hypothetical protein [Profundibacterium mesophilum]|uniref:Flagellar FliJ protein n=1 Tax=Profundibacterium mesophilum KAUST100406-0324 TaxID=1037889 RepID=A0A921NPI4_9RHOB|nr:hypothetical protein [Profundibacterium mesophilum]KAF0674660.1 hypothetical protein PMES_03042 [Profundibacterium mesophilum KAUST100406-0324]
MTSSPKRIAALALLERVRRHEMEDDSRALATLRGEIAELTDRGRALEGELHREAHAAGIESAAYLGDYIRAVRATLAGYEARISQITPEADRLETAVMERFREIKTFQSVRLAGLAANAAARDKLEADAQSEMVLLRWKRG